jgi:dienelactone hydrolase
MLRRTFVLTLPLALAACTTSWSQRRDRRPTQLLRRGPSPSSWKPQQVPEGVEEVRVPGPTGPLLAWFAAPPGVGKRPGLVYFHGEFAFAAWDFKQIRPFYDAGFAVMTPTLRGENGNPGAFELLRGEVDDARAAVEWFAARPEVDATRIYTLGHSVGGGVSALLSLVPDLPVARTASVGGIYEPATFTRWTKYDDTKDLVRFDPGRRDEVELRVLGPHLGEMQRPHHAYVGDGDTAILGNARGLLTEAQRRGAPFELTVVAGDHAGSLQPGIRACLADLQRAR